VTLYQYAQNKGKKLAIISKVEALVYILAHEMRHLWQDHGIERNSIFPTGYARNSRGRFSEVDTESYAVNQLRAWRRTACDDPPRSRRRHRTLHRTFGTLEHHFPHCDTISLPVPSTTYVFSMPHASLP
jgi:hypothetical protein